MVEAWELSTYLGQCDASIPLDALGDGQAAYEGKNSQWLGFDELHYLVVAEEVG